MKSLMDYELIVNDVFYRSEHILDYIERHKDMSDLDKEALENTILDALVDKGLLDPTKESLDLEHLAVVSDLEHKVYEKTPRVTSIPLSMKEAMRSKSVYITGGIPVSVFYSKPAGGASFCIYDMNTALSTIFDDFSFVSGTYDSPTRNGVRTSTRPFLEIDYHGEAYYVDALTKRLLKKDWFDKEFNLEESFRATRSTFDKMQRRMYGEQSADVMEYGTFLQFLTPVIEDLRKRDDLNGSNAVKMAEMTYEYDKSKEYFPQAFAYAEVLRKDFEKFMILNKNISDKK